MNWIGRVCPSHRTLNSSRLPRNLFPRVALTCLHACKKNNRRHAVWVISATCKNPHLRRCQLPQSVWLVCLLWFHLPLQRWFCYWMYHTQTHPIRGERAFLWIQLCLKLWHDTFACCRFTDAPGKNCCFKMSIKACWFFLKYEYV